MSRMLNVPRVSFHLSGYVYTVKKLWEERTRRLFPQELIPRYRIDVLREGNFEYRISNRERDRDRGKICSGESRTLESGATRTYVTPARNTAFII